ncbi:hypothetical protein Skr01_15470 [Sphaerisporangium krabiense]|uniref:PSer/pThr/pTyr-binding forkhead associated (FHA) protein n=1 Tax=Sphaerisporangium krabiense TaxID=763782 RepID=A0A7W8YZB6_9ACTN|nr:FHA domain-containing protein [Sphaerisporangium krabiense]MBB5624584.1 pSer/pThr/pTyr-binding forkhead associated (FHA) protein [Sphaerisporangium krabiense]GII61462.1 hypothetical protein Skr01_15470 [Sphaerisporangium krabiense]
MTRKCPYCDYTTEDASAFTCPHDHSPLAEVRVAALRLSFQDGTVVEVGPGEEVRLGRDPEWSGHAGWLGAFARVSRRHATVGLRGNGTAYVVAEDDTRNDTYVDGAAVRKGLSTTLGDGCTLRLSTQLSARVSLPEEAR